jgi:hypothetical protein
MAIDARIKSVTEDGSNLVLELEPRAEGILAGQERLTIVDFTHKPIVGQEIWGGSDKCRIEPLNGEGETRVYRRIMYSRLREEK